MENKIREEQYPVIFPPDRTCPYNAPFTSKEINSALLRSTSKSPGTDSIPFAFLQNMSTHQQSEFLAFLNYIWNSQQLPHQWKDAVICPILKIGELPTEPKSYRPIALTNCICKLLERIVTKRLQAFLENGRHIAPHQSGFRAGHSTLDNLARLESAARIALIQDDFCIAVFLDISKAFDTVWHHGLLRKLHDMGLTGNLPEFIKSFLSSRSIRVRVGNTLSNSHNIHSSVPQGSVVSPTLFNIMINDMFDQCPQEIQKSLYADDGALWFVHQDLEEGLQVMQEAIDAVTA